MQPFGNSRHFGSKSVISWKEIVKCCMTIVVCVVSLARQFLQLAGSMVHASPASGENGLVNLPYLFSTTMSKKFLDKP